MPIKIENLTNLKIRSIFDLCFDVKGKNFCCFLCIVEFKERGN